MERCAKRSRCSRAGNRDRGCPGAPARRSLRAPARALTTSADVFSGTAAFGEGGTAVESAHVVWRGPVVMNTDEELREAFRELNEGTFVKKQG